MTRVMPEARTPNGKPERSIELLPRAVLAVGVTGHRKLRADANTSTIATTLDALFADLSRALREVAQHEAPFFSKAAPVLRTVCMAAEGADLLGAQAARAAGSAIVCVLPFPFDEYARDFSSSTTANAARSLFEGADARLILPGERAEHARSYERANEVILANIDLLVAVWDGKRASGRAGTGDVVQSAIFRKIPVIVIAPDRAEEATLLIGPDDEELANPIALDLARKPLDLPRLVSRVLLPPRGQSARQGLIDLLEEKDDYRTIRFEYPLLLKLFGVGGVVKTGTEARAKLETQSTPATASLPRHLAPQSQLLGDLGRIDSLANHYGRLYRSSTASEFLLTILAALFSAVAFVLFPFIAGVSVIVQVLVNGLVLLDSMTRTTQRWQERWLDYRVIAERLRCLRFLHPLGFGFPADAAPFRRYRESWVEWYLRRYARALDPPHGTIGAGEVAGLANQLVESEIPEQLKYHRANFRQLGLLDRRLSAAARVALASAIVVAGLYGISAYYFGGVADVSWKPVAIVLFFVLPAMAAAFNGIRAAADLVRLAERSAAMAAALTRLRRVILSTPMSYDQLAVAAVRVAKIMGDELGEWRFVLESRRARAQRSHVSGRSCFSLRRLSKVASNTQ
jgi:hypothetical protein